MSPTRSPNRVALMVALVVASVAAVSTAQEEPTLRERVGRMGFAATDSIRRTGDVDGAIAFLADLRNEAEAAADSVATLDAMRLQSYWLRKFGQLQVAIDIGAHGAEMAAALRDTTRLCSELYKLGLAVQGAGDVARADTLYARVLELAKLRNDEVYQARARSALGRRAAFAGDYDIAREHLEWAVALTRQKEMKADEVMALNMLGLVHSYQGGFAASRECFDRCVALSREIDYPYGLIQGLTNLAYLENHLGDPSEAARAYKANYEYAKEMGEVNNVFTVGTNYAHTLAQIGRDDEAEALLRELLAEVPSLGDAQAVCNVHIHMGYFLLKTDRLDEAEVHLNQALELSRAQQYVTGEIRALHRLADVKDAKGEEQLARDLLLQAEKDLAGRASVTQYLPMRDALSDIQFRMGNTADALRRWIEIEAEARGIGHTLAMLESLTGQAECYESMDMPDSVAAVLKRASGAWEEERSTPDDPEWREQRGSFGREVYIDLARNLANHPLTVSPAERTRAAFEAAQRYKARTLWERMVGPAVEVHEAEFSPPRLDELQNNLLQEGELLLDTYVGDSASLLFAVTRSSCRWVELPGGNELAEKLLLHQQLLSDPESVPAADHTILDAAATAVIEMLFSGVREEVAAADRILFLPDGPLHLLPLASLAQCEAGRDLGLANKEIQRIPSVTILERLRRRDLPTGDVPTDIVAIAGGANDAGQQLLGAMDEVRDLGRRFQRVATHMGVLPDESVLSQGRVLHLAAHTRVDGQRPWRSGLLLAAPERSYLGSVSSLTGAAVLRSETDAPEQRYLRASEIAGLDLNATLAVLSGCESAGGRILAGEGVQGLAHAFLSAQVSVVVATLWPLDDGTASGFMRVFYRELSNGHSVAGALSRAQAKLRENPRTRHPFYWAGYVLIGDGSTLVPLERRTASIPWVWAMPVVVALIAAFAVRRNRVAA